MAAIQSTSNNPSQALLDSVNGQKNSKTNSIDNAQDRFMTLLVTQMKNQDPLNPMDNAQVTSQMAQLSTVTGIDKLNNTLELLIGNVQAGQSYQASSMIGHSVLSPGNEITTNGEGGFFGADLPIGADKLTVTIKDAAGNVVRTLDLGKQNAGTAPLNWDGFTNDGSVAKSGIYQFELAATIANNTAAASGLSFAQVMSISNNANGIKLNLSNMTSVNTSDVKEIF
ncbi:MAG: flagellar hook assembly protein FlgD [Methylotenera sp.]|nr:flagellar hook assembly protein FlgD [Methylotenera sp.]MDP1753920.1 flagellar hook assembly protein FlgD [Methylotenera sp.]MDP1959312.1 flagellar hook assembly protein FlgD [Methylotenera sp.]MDP3303355.1 flagellar hook assembly protein FlgD [Methylotenera sp.]MDP3943952.1 flagellar hook assembly protein FlgD [Methylotenera sp.]